MTETLQDAQAPVEGIDSLWETQQGLEVPVEERYRWPLGDTAGCPGAGGSYERLWEIHADAWAPEEDMMGSGRHQGDPQAPRGVFGWDEVRGGL